VHFAKTAKLQKEESSVQLRKRLAPLCPEKQAAFDTLREHLCHPPIPATPRQDGKYNIDVDASYDQLGYCLLQQQPEESYQAARYFSKGLLPAEMNYIVIETERPGNKWAVGSHLPYIEGIKFLIQCDHKALKWILATTTCNNNRLNRRGILPTEFAYDAE